MFNFNSITAKNIASILILSFVLMVSACSSKDGSEEVKEIASDAKEVVADVKEAVGDAKDDVKEAAKEIKNDVNEAIEEVKEEMIDTSKEAKDVMQEKIKAMITPATETLNIEENDPFIWLEEVEGEKALAWVDAKNKDSLSYLQKISSYKDLFDKNLAVYDSEERIESPQMIGGDIYNFWRDANNTRGILRRTTINDYLSGTPKWKTVLDIDAIAKAEDKNWVYKGRQCLAPDYTRCILNLSDGGTDAVVRREYDLNTQSFIEDGFITPESKGNVAWLDKDHLLIATDFGENSMTDSGYPSITKLWKRGTSLSQAKKVFEGEKEDVGVWGNVIVTPEGDYPLVIRAKTFYTSELYFIKVSDDRSDIKTVKLDLPEDFGFDGLTGIFKEQMLVQTKSDWNVGGKTLSQGTLASIGFDNFLGGKRNFTVIREPTERSSIASVSNTKDSLIVSVLDNVRSEFHKYEYAHGKWSHSAVDTPELGSLSLVSANDDSNQFFYTYNGFLSPTSLYHVDDDGKSQKLDSLPDFFDASPYKVQQFETESKDGTKVPYFMISKKDVALDGKNPTILYGYGGFEISLRPSYSSTIGMDWLEQGGVYVLSNIRGGGEFGPKWHQAALKEKRMRAYEDFFAIAEDLIERKVTSPQHLGIRGGSNGGLLMGVAYTKRPDLFNAVACGVPLLDMKRFNKLLAGASWMGEYGDPDIPEQWEYIKEYSPYHNLEKNKEYPKVFFYTSTKDDRVHPGHARKMVAQMEAYGHPYLYYENTEGGHAASSNNKQTAKREALIYSYFIDQLFKK